VEVFSRASQRGARRSIWVFASSIAAVLSGQAKPTSRCGNATPLMIRGSLLARRILACQRPLPASKLSMLNSPWKVVISVAPHPRLLRSGKHGRGENNVSPFTGSGVFAGRRRPWRGWAFRRRKRLRRIVPSPRNDAPLAAAASANTITFAEFSKRRTNRRRMRDRAMPTGCRWRRAIAGHMLMPANPTTAGRCRCPPR